MRKIKITAILLILAILLCSCGSASSEDTANTKSDVETKQSADTETEDEKDVPEDLTVDVDDELIKKYSKDEKAGFFDADYSAITDIIFSEGNSEEWKYSHNKREFPIDQCYCKIATTAITKHFWGKEDAFVVYFVFTGTENCQIEPTKGVLDSVDSGNPNVIVFKKKLYAAKKKKAEAVNSEFKITPKKACGLRIDVIYDKQVPRQYDDSSTIYFTNKKEEEK